jgi:hypothetical protein
LLVFPQKHNKIKAGAGEGNRTLIRMPLRKAEKTVKRFIFDPHWQRLASMESGKNATSENCL